MPKVTYQDFGLGINDRTPASQLDDHEVVQALNVEFDKHNNLRTRHGVTRINTNKNLLKRSEEFNLPPWSFVNMFIDPDVHMSPVNTLTGDNWEATGGSNKGVQSIVIPDDSSKYTFSIYIKKLFAVGTFMHLKYTGGLAINESVEIVQAGEIVTLAPSLGVLDYSIEDIDDSWYRISLTVANNNSGNTTLEAEIHIDSGFPGIGFWGAQVERGKLGPYNKIEGTPATLVDQYITKRFTSLYEYIKTDETKALITTAGSKAYRLDEANNWLIPIDSAVTLPDDTFWQWVLFDNIAIGVNRGSVGFDNPVKLDSATGNLAALGGTPPKARYIEVWNSRVWIVDEDTPNILHCSALGTAEDWTTTGIAGTQSFEFYEVSKITGIKATKDRLIVFGENYTFAIVPGSPNTDISQYEFQTLNSRIGCISAYSIQILLEDMVFLSREGLTSLSAIEKYGDFEQAILSRNMQDFYKFSFPGDACASVIYPSKSQYILSLPFLSEGFNSTCVVLDYTGIQANKVGFTRFDKKMIASCYTSVLFQNKSRVYLGGYPDPEDADNAYIYRYDDDNVFNDDDELYECVIITKAHDFEETILNKIFHRIYFKFELLTDIVDLALGYKFNESDLRVKSFVKNFSGEVFAGGIWDSSVWDTSFWATQDSPERIYHKKVAGFPGRIGRSIQLSLASTVVDQGFVFKGYAIDVNLVTHKQG